MSPLKVFIADDEAPARERMKELLGDIAAQVPTEVAGIWPCQRPGATSASCWVEPARSGSSTPTLRLPPLVSGPVTVSWMESPLGLASTVSFSGPAAGSVQSTILANRVADTGERRNPPVQWPVESLVHATERPRP